MEHRPVLKAIDLFCGCGGLTLGLKQAGFSVIGAMDIDDLAIETYRENHPEVRVWRTDIKNLPVSKVKRDLGIRKGQLDLLAACPPCQGFSSMRTMNGSRRIEDARNDLIFDFIRFIEELRPKAIMMENVPGLIKDKRMTVLLDNLKQLGYCTDNIAHVLNAANFGVPQRRYRTVLITGRYGTIAFASNASKRHTVRDAIFDLPLAGTSGDPLHDFPEKRTLAVLEKIKLIPKDGGSRTDLPPEAQLACHKTGRAGFKDVYGRMCWGDVAPTITGGCTNPSKGRFIHPEANRAITLREAALLQSFPLDYRFSLRKGKHAAATMIGNALPPEFIKQHALKIYEYLQSLSH